MFLDALKCPLQKLLMLSYSQNNFKFWTFWTRRFHSGSVWPCSKKVLANRQQTTPPNLDQKWWHAEDSLPILDTKIDNLQSKWYTWATSWNLRYQRSYFCEECLLLLKSFVADLRSVNFMMTSLHYKNKTEAVKEKKEISACISLLRIKS